MKANHIKKKTIFAPKLKSKQNEKKFTHIFGNSV